MIRQSISLTSQNDAWLKDQVENSAEASIHQAVKIKLRKLWLQENKDFLLSSNAFIEENGLPLEKFRSF
ncbi:MULTISPECIES: type II toxin-antitoxin system CcdA family antitoxin [unclassified Marinobacterium]|jgi:antitoxin CcdA|uniref:type II toxin-antitoxin system CcdA family antitoxin n=1 Tax=unclassified Marinobacterium TaxID=2644139 RepID=UPI001568960A|nr:Post-segregation antitoxin CcdA [Marinobacterium sp. xm-g-48]NRP26561.1 Post-segregation antitoxin CcdA [Marinobacterium sp. xm-d-420]NRP37575.1 Post-segregation antitoxin CcdA [Marinobacterium sp. xm-a-121]NRP56608.1 Post-segregation antitoxin CcdA [Marinobacterium sp. xm-d-510]NRP82240.1 Post-segregation antitoxin CcdA [Marinobacterium sp. xm-d-509]NRP96603.1 Post-segregation antitoxin CcdA [Marinobacterium sp. xm-a-127]NRP99919.1 Post-segregation antitoxin CcdA [Marinobacterium sp. xm-v